MLVPMLKPHVVSLVQIQPLSTGTLNGPRCVQATVDLSGTMVQSTREVDHGFDLQEQSCCQSDAYAR